jgi:hypothetical protein
VFCFPEEAAGPDVVTLLQLPGDSKHRERDKGLLLWSAQVKLLASNLGGKKFQRAAHTSMYDHFYDATQTSGKRQRENKEKVQAVCRQLCRADTRSLSTLCVLPGVTRAWSQPAAATLERPQGNEFVVLDQETLGKIMSPVAFRAACGGAAASANVDGITDGVRGLDFGSSGGGGCGGGGGGSDEAAK